MKKQVQVQITVEKRFCDFCVAEAEKNHCAICGKDVCSFHTGDWCDDGVICQECSKTYEFMIEGDIDASGEPLESGAIGAWNKLTREAVEMRYI